MTLPKTEQSSALADPTDQSASGALTGAEVLGALSTGAPKQVTTAQIAALAQAPAANGTATSAGTLTGAEIATVSRGAGFLSTTLSGIAAFVLSCFGVPSVAALRALPSVIFTRAATAGYSTPGDGGHGQYYFTQTGSLPPDNGVTTLLSSDGRGYWTLVTSGTLDIKQAGAQAGMDCSAAVTAAIAAVRSSNGAITRLVFSAVAGGWQFAHQVLLSASNITYEFFSDLYNTSTTYQTPLIFAHDLNAQPVAPLSNVVLIGNGHTWYQNGRACAILAGYSPTVPPTVFPAPMFNYISRLQIRGLVFNDGMYDSLNLRQCQDHLVDGCDFTDAYTNGANGINVTTDYAAFVQGDYSTYSHGIVRDCTAYGNASMGMTYYSCSGGTFDNCRSYNNGQSGFSYEAPPGAGTAKYAEGCFSNCRSNNNGWNGWYITQSGVTVDADCRSYGNGTVGVAADTSGLQLCGVVVSGADKVVVLGDHYKAARHGVTFLGAASLQPTWECGGRYENNAGNGINAQGLYRMTIRAGTSVRLNGNIEISGAYSAGVFVNNSAYNQNAGILIADEILSDGNGVQAMYIEYVDSVSTKGILSYNDNASHGIGGSGLVYNNIGVLECQNNMLRTPNGNTGFAYVVNNTVLKAYVWGNKSDQTTGTVMTNNASTRFGLSSMSRISLGTYTTETTLPSTGTAVLSDVVNVLSTLIAGLYDSVTQS
jgi:hypothetical protein